MFTEPLTVQLQLSVDVVKALQAPDEQAVVQKLFLTLIVALFQHGAFSLGKAAELVAMPLAQFMDVLREHGVPAVTVTEDDFSADLATLNKLGL